MLEKQGLSTDQLLMVQGEFQNKKINKTTAYLFWFFLGGFGGHRFYIGDKGLGIAMLFLNWMTLGIWGLIDGFFLSGKVNKLNDEIEKGIVSQVRLYSKAN